MPGPIEILLDPLSLVFIGLYALMIIWEAINPAVTLPVIAGWRTRGLISFVIYFYLSSYLPLLWDGIIARWQLFDLTDMSVQWQFIVGLMVFEGMLYAWHRAMHTFTPLWRSFHQMHHSAERLDTYGAFWFSPLDMIGFTLTGSLALVLLVGIGPAAATAILLFTFFLAVFQHMNIRTPQWLGYFIQRPESHAYHHGRGLHRNNYSDLPVFDILFGTFSNPEIALPTGLSPGASSRVVDMLLFRDVSAGSAVDL